MWIFRELREAHDRTTARWPAAPWMLARAFAKHVKDCMWGWLRHGLKFRSLRSLELPVPS